MKIMKPIFAIAIVLMAISGCKKNEETKPVSAPLSYTSLTAEQNTISTSQSPKITATATGEGLTYTWTLDGTGSIIGSGYQITYQPCCAGQNTINCVVKDLGGNQESKSVTITVQ